MADLVEIQKKLREDFIKRLSSKPAEEFLKAKCFFYPRSHEIQKQYLDLEKKIKTKGLENSSFAEVSFPKEIRPFLDKIDSSLDSTVGYFTTYYPGSSAPYIYSLSNPFYKLKFKILRDSFDELAKLGNQNFLFVSSDFKKGFSVKACVGYLPVKNYNHDERYFEIYAWGI